MTLTTKSTCIPLVVSSVYTHAHVLELHVPVDRTMTYVQGTFYSGNFFLEWQFITQAVLPLVQFFLESVPQRKLTLQVPHAFGTACFSLFFLSQWISFRGRQLSGNNSAPNMLDSSATPSVGSSSVASSMVSPAPVTTSY